MEDSDGVSEPTPSASNNVDANSINPVSIHLAFG